MKQKSFFIVFERLPFGEKIKKKKKTGTSFKESCILIGLEVFGK